MEIKSVNQNNKISKIQNLAKNDAGFVKDETIFARVVSLEGEEATLQTKDEMLLAAKVIADVEISVGDELELLIQGRQNGKYILRALAINPDKVEISSELVQPDSSDAENKLIKGSLLDYGIKADEDNIKLISGAIAKYPALDIKTASFMLANGVEIGADSIDAIKSADLGHMTVSSTLEKIVAFIVGDAVLPDELEPQEELKVLDESLLYANRQKDKLNTTNSENGKAQLKGQINFTQNKAFYSFEPSTTERAAGSANKSTEDASAIKLNAESNSVEMSIETARTNAAGQIRKIIDILFEKGQHVSLDDVKEPVASNRNTANEAGINDSAQSAKDIPVSEYKISPESIFSNQKTLEVIKKAVSVFTSNEDLKGDDKSINLKENPVLENLMQLKTLLKNSDIKTRDVLAQQVDGAINQKEATDQIMRFNVLYIPVTLANERQTAQLYIYKRRRSGQKKSDQTTNILVGIDTNNLGRFEVLLSINGNNAKLRISRDNDKANELIELRAKTLKGAFADIGFNMTDFKLERLHEKTTLINAEQVLAAGSGYSPAKIDFTV